MSNVADKPGWARSFPDAIPLWVDLSRTDRASHTSQALSEGKLLVSFLRPPDNVGMSWRWLIEVQSERASGVYLPPA